MAFFLSGVLVSAPGRARAEYRVFELEIANSQTSSTRIVHSTLDDRQYPGYFPLRQGEQVRIRDMWMCWQRGDYLRPLCPNPNANQAAAAR